MVTPGILTLRTQAARKAIVLRSIVQRNTQLQRRPRRRQRDYGGTTTTPPSSSSVVRSVLVGGSSGGGSSSTTDANHDLFSSALAATTAAAAALTLSLGVDQIHNPKGYYDSNNGMVSSRIPVTGCSDGDILPSLDNKGSARNVTAHRMRSIRARNLDDKYNVDWKTVLGEGAYGSVHPARVASTGEKVRLCFLFSWVLGYWALFGYLWAMG